MRKLRSLQTAAAPVALAMALVVSACGGDGAVDPDTAPPAEEAAGLEGLAGQPETADSDQAGEAADGSPHTNSASDPGPGYTIPDEPAFVTDPATGQPVGPYRYGPGQLVMARSAGFDSAGAQFFITTGPNASRLDSQGTYVVFGSTDAAGLAVAQSIIGLHVAGGSLGGAPSRSVKVRSVTIEETPVGRLPSDFTNAAICEAAGFRWSEESETCS